ncbi:MAG: MFS transporter [Nitrososphaeria archaeon]|nr:MFS transporter [Nitrososphaeria archaeon]
MSNSIQELRLWKLRMWYINIITLLFSILFQGISTILSQYAVIRFNATPIEVGIVWSVFYLTSIITRPISGLAFDQGYRFRLLILGSLMFFISSFIYFFSSDITHLLIARFLQGSSQGIFMTTSFSLVAYEASQHMEYFEESISWRSTMLGLGVIIGPALGGYLISFYGFHETFVFMILLAAIIPIIVYYTAKTTKVEERLTYFNLKFDLNATIKKDLKIIIKNFIELMHITSFKAALFSLILYAIGYVTVTSLLPAYYATLFGKGSGVIVGNCLALIGLSSIIPRIFTGKISKHVSVKKIATLNLFTLALSLAFIGLYPFPPNVYIFCLSAGLSLGFVIPSLQIMALIDTGNSKKGIATGFYIIGFDLSNLISPIIFGSLGNIFGYKFVMEITFIPVLFASLYLMLKKF